MGPTTSIIAGLAVVGAGVALYRFARRKSAQLKSAIEEFRRSSDAVSTIDFEKDPTTGAWRQRG